MMKNILVTGSNGQLGNELKEQQDLFPNFKLFFTDLPELDVTDEDALNTFIQHQAVDFIINCAAYTAVDKAESEPEQAMLLNARAPELLALLAKKHSFGLVHISTDYVFDGLKNAPLTENDTPNPQSVYGKTKLAGEQAIQKSEANALILRTAWLYSYYGSNFVKTILRLAKERDEIRVVNDQFGSPTYAADLANCILNIIENQNWSGVHIYNYSNEGHCSWYEFAKAIIEFSGMNCKVVPIKTGEYPQAAPRPAYSILDKSKIISNFGMLIPHWTVSLKKCLEKIKNNPV